MTPAASVEAVLTGPRSIRFRERHLTDLKEDWVRVRFAYCGLCGSDLSTFEGRREIDYPLSLGHEFVGVVTAVGDAVVTASPGDVITSDFNYRCGSCDRCRAGRSHLCRQGKLGLFTNRAFAEFGDMHCSYVVHVDEPVRRHLALTEPLSCVLHAKQWAALRPDDRILVIGAGGLGAAMAFALCNQSPEVPFEITDEMPSRLSAIDAAVAPTGHGVAQPKGEYDVVFDLSGSEAGLRSACAHVVAGGRLCSMSHLDGYSNAEFLLTALTRRDVTFTVSYLNGERTNLEEAARLLQREWSHRWDPLIDVVRLDHLEQAFEGRRASPWCKTIVRLSPDGP